MLCTCTRSPPSWDAMLPQKFSAATTRSLPPPAPSELLDPPIVQAVRHATRIAIGSLVSPRIAVDDNGNHPRSSSPEASGEAGGSGEVASRRGAPGRDRAVHRAGALG